MVAFRQANVTAEARIPISQINHDRAAARAFVVFVGLCWR